MFMWDIQAVRVGNKVRTTHATLGITPAFLLFPHNRSSSLPSTRPLTGAEKTKEQAHPNEWSNGLGITVKTQKWCNDIPTKLGG